MSEELKRISDEKLKTKGTGDMIIEEAGHNHIIYPFDKYEVTVELTPDNKFIGISEIKVNKDFRSYKQRIITKGFHDVDEFYKE